MSFKQLWVDKYSPNTFADYVWENNEAKARFAQWISEGATDNLIFHGPPGTGKSSLARILMKELKIDECDFLKINAAREGNIDTIRQRIVPFVNSGGFSGLYKYVILEEATGLSSAAQDALKEDIEATQNMVRWIFTTNDLRKVADAIQDRCSIISFQSPDQEAFLDRILFVLENEKVDYSYSDEILVHVQSLIKKHYPSLRGAIRALEYHTINGRLELTPSNSFLKNPWRETMINLFKGKKIREARDTIAANAISSDYEDLYRWVYENIDLFNNPDSALIILANGYRSHTLVADPEINFSATLTEIVLAGG